MSNIQIAGLMDFSTPSLSKPEAPSSSSLPTTDLKKKRTLDSFINDKTKKEIQQKEQMFLEGGIAMAMRNKAKQQQTKQQQTKQQSFKLPSSSTRSDRSKAVVANLDKMMDTTLSDNGETKLANINKRRLNFHKQAPTAPTSSEEDKKEDFSAVINSELFSSEPITSLTASLSPVLIDTLTKQMGLTNLTKIQSRTLQPIMKGSNILMKSETGSGKTLAYLIPVLQMLINLSQSHKITREEGTYAIVLAPTRELCMQVDRVLNKLTKSFPHIVCGGVLGGEKKKSEKERLRKGVTILVATPGRLEDHLRTTQSFRCDQLKYLILDEADILLDYGCEEKVQDIYNMILQRKMDTLKYATKDEASNSIQKVLVSATLHSRIQQLAQQISVTNCVYVGLGSEGDFLEQSYNLLTDKLPSNIFTIPAHLTQHYIIVPPQFRLVMLAGFLRSKTTPLSEQEELIQRFELGSTPEEKTPPGKVIVFLSCCDSVEFHYNFFKYFQTKFKFIKEVVTTTHVHAKNASDSASDKLVQSVTFETNEPLIHVPLFKLHGDIDQKERTAIFKKFSEAKEGILFCTDVAARGLDLPSIQWIVQYDPPGNPKEYLHRIGRTARMGTKGNAVMFLHPHEELYKKLLEKYKLTIHEIKGEQCLESIILSFRRKSMRDPIECASWLQNIFEQELVNSKEGTELYSLAVNSYFSYIRYYSTHGSDVKYIFHPNNLHLGHVAKSFALKDTPTKIRERQETLGVRSLSIKKQELEKTYSMKDKLPKKEFLKRIRDIKGSSSIKSSNSEEKTEKKRKRKEEVFEEESSSDEDETNESGAGYESFSDEDETPDVPSSGIRMRFSKNVPAASSASTTATGSAPAAAASTFGGKTFSFGKPANSDGTEANQSLKGSFSQKSEPAAAVTVVDSNGEASNNSLTPLQLRQMELKKKKLNPNERMKLYRDYEKGKILPSRPKIVIPEGLRKNKKNAPSTSDDAGVSFDYGKVVDKPLSEYDKLLSRYVGSESTKTGRMMMSATSEFDSSVPSSNKMRLNPNKEQDDRRAAFRGGRGGRGRGRGGFGGRGGGRGGNKRVKY